MCFGRLSALLHRESDKEGSADDKTPLAAVRGLLLPHLKLHQLVAACLQREAR